VKGRRRSEPSHPSRAEWQAAIWCSKLKRASISIAELYAFRAWCAVPENQAAFDRLVALDPEARARLLSS
jgi:ferric-dicitrate binding protein FerR (iron transport regulator)